MQLVNVKAMLIQFLLTFLVICLQVACRDPLGIACKQNLSCQKPQTFALMLVTMTIDCKLEKKFFIAELCYSFLFALLYTG